MITHTDTESLYRFLNFPLTRTDEIFKLFSSLPGSRVFGSGRKQVLYAEGSRSIKSGRCLLVAHADTVWDESWPVSRHDQNSLDREFPCLIETDGIIRSAAANRGIGADDRAGLAMLWQLKELGHSLLITDLEEHGRIGSCEFRDKHPKVLAQINREHAFAIQFDRCNGRDFKCYDVGTDEFRKYICQITGYTEPDRYSFTDISTLCAPRGNTTRMCGVNLSVGYYDEHTADEYLVIREWTHTLAMARQWLSGSILPKFRRKSKGLT